MLKALKSKLPGSSSGADASEPAKAAPATSTAPATNVNGEVVGAETRLKGLDATAERQLRSAGVDLISCAACPSPCDPLDPTLDPSSIHPEKTLRAWSKQSIDFEASMLPSTTPFYRHALISTGKKDWPHDVASVEGSLANWFGEWAGEVGQEEEGSRKVREEEEQQGTAAPALPEGCWQTTLPHSTRRRRQAHDQDVTAPLPGGPTRVLVSNSSHISSSCHHNGQSVMLFPDWVLLSDVCDGSGSGGGSAEEAEEAKTKTKELYRTQIAAAGPSSPPAPASRPRRTVLPYRAVVVLCSHTKRDVRCGLAAPLLAEVLRRHAEAEGWEVDERGDDIDHHDKDDTAGPCEFDEEMRVPKGRGWGYVEETSDGAAASPSEQILNWRKQLCPSSSSSPPPPSGLAPPPTLGIFYCSHIGKHAWAGNVIVYLPSGAGVWYGRVDPLKGAGRVFQETILKGKVIPEYLRAGIDLYRGEEGEEGVVSGDREQLVGGETKPRSLLSW